MRLDIHAKLNSLLALSAENDVVEFKEAKNTYDFSKLGKYFSALCNEANLKGVTTGWLVFGVNDHRQVVLDMDYARLLALDSGLDLQDIMALDRVQKRRTLNTDDERRLKSRGWIEGRKPNYFIARSLAQQTGQKAKYI